MIILFQGELPELDPKLYEVQDYSIDTELTSDIQWSDWVDRFLRYIPHWAIPIKNLESSDLYTLLLSISDFQNLRDLGTKESDESTSFAYFYQFIVDYVNGIHIATATGDYLDKIAYDYCRIIRDDGETDLHLRFRIYEKLYDFIPQENGYLRLVEKWLGNTPNTIGYRIRTFGNRVFESKDFGYLVDNEFACEINDTDFELYSLVRMDEDELTVVQADITSGILANGIIVRVGNDKYTVKCDGYVKNKNWSFTEGADLYLTDDGVITETITAQQIGTATKTNKIKLDFGAETVTIDDNHGLFSNTIDGLISRDSTVYIVVENAGTYGAIFSDLVNNPYLNCDSEDFLDDDMFPESGAGITFYGITDGSNLDKFIEEIDYTRGHGIDVVFELHHGYVENY